MSKVEPDIAQVASRFDHMSAAFATDPWTPMERLRERCPVARSEAHGGFWVLSSYDLINQVARDDVTWTSEEGLLIEGPQPIRDIPAEVDPPEFHKYRRFLNPLFSPGAVARREAVIRALANRLIDDFIEAGACDIHRAFAQPLPAILTYRMLGLPEEGAMNFVRQLEGSTSEAAPDDGPPEFVAGDGRMMAHFGTVLSTIEQRRAEPRDDIITYLLHNPIEGRGLDDEELLGVIDLILQGGLLTTTDAIGNALVRLEHQPEDRYRIIADPSLIGVAVEEFLRFESPVTALTRTATRDTELGGQKIMMGEKVLLVWASANRDASVFDDADRCVIDRAPNKHMAFGVGIHRCLGAHLARLELRVALEEILRRVPDYRIDLDGVVMAPVVGVNYGRTRIPMTFTPGRRENGSNDVHVGR